jgi:hypothetical protein
MAISRLAAKNAICAHPSRPRKVCSPSRPGGQPANLEVLVREGRETLVQLCLRLQHTGRARAQKFRTAATLADISRRYGGIHFEQGDLDARATGRAAATLVWHEAQEHWGGS